MCSRGISFSLKVKFIAFCQEDPAFGWRNVQIVKKFPFDNGEDSAILSTINIITSWILF